MDNQSNQNEKLKKVKISDIKIGPIRHAFLPEELIKRIKDYKEILAEVEKIPLEQTINNFQRDMHPEREIQIWEHIAKVYKSFISENSITDIDTKKEVYSVALIASTGMNDFKNIKILSKEQVEDIVSCFN